MNLCQHRTGKRNDIAVMTTCHIVKALAKFVPAAHDRLTKHLSETLNKFWDNLVTLLSDMWLSTSKMPRVLTFLELFCTHLTRLISSVSIHCQESQAANRSLTNHTLLVIILHD